MYIPFFIYVCIIDVSNIYLVINYKVIHIFLKIVFDVGTGNLILLITSAFLEIYLCLYLVH